jgi:hypothetical protein
MPLRNVAMLGIAWAAILWGIVAAVVFFWGCAETLPYCSGAECGGAGGAVELDGAAGDQ